MKRTNEVSEMAGVSRRTLQYYDDEEVLVAKRSEHNHRLYDEEALDGIWKIMLYKEMGFELKEIKCLLKMPEDEKNKCLGKQMDKLESSIEKLRKQKEFTAMILICGTPQRPAEHAETTYRKKIEELKKDLISGAGKKRPGARGKKYDADFIKRLRWRLDEAYQQLQQKQFRYALHDTYAVMRETLEALVRYAGCADYAGKDALAGIKLCERKHLPGKEEIFKSGLYNALGICRVNEQEFIMQDDLNYREVRFAIMQTKDLLNRAENILLRR